VIAARVEKTCGPDSNITAPTVGRNFHRSEGPMTATEIVMWIAVGMSVVSFLIYLFDAWSRYIAVSKGTAQLGQAKLEAAPESLGNMAKLAEALAKLTDSLTKAGPGLIALIASVLFLMIAGYIATAQRTPTAAPATPTPITPAPPPARR
jgi:hypothetical protein